jgi:hypothetical protein
MIAKQDNTPNLLVAKSRSLQEQMVLDLINEDNELPEFVAPNIAEKLNAELRTMTLADGSALLANKSALKLTLRNFAKMPDLPISMYFDNFIPWLDEPLWKQDYHPQTCQLYYLNMKTNEKLSYDEFWERVKTEATFTQSIQHLSEQRKRIRFATVCQRFVIGGYEIKFQKNYQSEWKKRKWSLQLWKWKEWKEASLGLEGNYTSSALRKHVTQMLKHSNYGTFDWYLGALIDHEVSYERWYNFSFGGLTLTRKELCDILMQVAYDVLCDELKQKHSLEYYKNKYSWLPEA